MSKEKPNNATDSTSIYKHLLVQDQDAIRIIKLNNPQRLNALHGGLLVELDQAFVAIAQNPHLRGVLLCGAGEKAFAAGADIKEFVNLTPESAHALSVRGHAVFNRVAACPVPVVAAVHGYALGGGCELALAAHIRIAASNAVFGQPELNLGLIPGYGGCQRLVECVGKSRAIEWILTTCHIPAPEALAAGLVSKVVPVDKLHSSAMALLQRIAQQPPLATRMALAAIQSQNAAHEATAFALCANSQEAHEGVHAFLNKSQNKHKSKHKSKRPTRS